MSYLTRKKTRLRVKYSNILLKDFGILISHTASHIIAICNGGLGNGITQDMIFESFQKFENLESISMVPHKSYSFVKFLDENSALEAFNKLNGETLWPSMNGPVHLEFVKDFNLSVILQRINFEKPPGLVLLEDFVTEQEEFFILELVGINNLNEKYSSELKHRKVKHFGYEFNYSTNNVDLNNPIEKIPEELNFLWQRLKDYSCGSDGLIDFTPDQLTINYYNPGQGIPPHVDTHSAFENGIISLSLLSSIVMDFKNKDEISKSVILPRRSLCVMLDESRYDWTHGIAARKCDLVPTNNGALIVQKRKVRISLTFRKTRKQSCTCKYPRFCDTALANLKSVSDKNLNLKNLNLKKELASELEGNYVQEVYEKIASHFSETRHKPWPNIQKFVESFGPGSILIDVGCGNGKYFSKQNVRFEIGCDSSIKLMDICRSQGFECFSCNCLNIPIKNNVADGCICIAVIHHLTTEERRKKAIEEIIRVLRKGGKALLYVWAKNQEIENKKSSYIKEYNSGEKIQKSYEFQLVNLNNSEEKLLLPVHVNRTNFNHNDLLVPWKLKIKENKTKNISDPPVYLRFYHVFENDELKNMCLQMNNVNVLDYYYDQGNWCILLEKIY